MYARYNISPEVKQTLITNEQYKQKGLELKAAARSKKEKRKNDFLSSLNPQDDGSIDMSTFEKTCFPTPINKDIFISHSHADDSEKEGDYLASLVGFLEVEFGIQCFVDDWEWGYCDELLYEIDKKYARHRNGKTFSYEVRNITTALAHVPVTIALLKAMDATECTFFLETSNSTSLDLNSSKNTRSPWLYAENAAMELLRPSPRPRLQTDTQSYIAEASSHKLPEFKFKLTNNGIPTLNYEFLLQWRNEYYSHDIDFFSDNLPRALQARKALDWLYNQKPDGIKYTDLSE